MAHLGPLPGTPLYDEALGVQGIVDGVARDLGVLLQFPFDAVMFCNEGDRPYSLRAGFEGVAVMARVAADLAPRDRPFGVDFLWDGRAALAVAAATGAAFIREVVTGAYESDMGVWAPDAGELLRYRRTLGAQQIAVFMNVTPEFASTIGTRTVGQLARSAAVSSLADAILVSGPMAGEAPDPAAIREAKQATGGLAPVLANTGAKAGNVVSFLEVADGIIVGSDLKEGGSTWNPVDPEPDDSRWVLGLMTNRLIAEMEDAMQPQAQHPGFQGWQRLVGRWATQATHPAFPGTVVSGHATFEWLEDQRFLIWRSHYDHPHIPDAFAVMGIIDGKPSMHYFDHRGVHRVFAVDFTVDTWRFWNEAPGFSQRFTGTFSDGDNTINGAGELSRDDGATWEPDLAITYRKTG